MKKDYKSFGEFYLDGYVPAHSHPRTKLLHFVGLFAALVFGVKFLITLALDDLVIALALGYGFPIISHYLYENNAPATYGYPFYSFIANLVMFYEILLGRHRII